MKTNATHRLIVTADHKDGKYTGETEVSFKVRGDAQFMVPKLLKALAFLGSAGASRTIIIEDMCASADGRYQEGDLQFGFDGDGSDKITDIMVNGKPYEERE
jgi:hypothetical protein